MWIVNARLLTWLPNFKIRSERGQRDLLVRLSLDWTEVAYIKFGISGLQAEVEFPSDWHEERRGWVRLGFGLAKVCFSFPWKWVVPDEHQCSGPTYGFHFYEDLLWLRYGKAKGTRDDPTLTIYMPWHWKHRLHEVLGEPELHPYTYELRSGEIQDRTATIKPERRVWTRCWLPWKLERRTIDIRFDNEVGERSGSWKGGVLGCGFDMLPGETPVQALRRMEGERKFN
jgi:hypothetical protein